MLVILKHAICQFYHIGYLQHIALMRLVFTEQMLEWCTLEVGCCVLNCAHQKSANIIKEVLLWKKRLKYLAIAQTAFNPPL